MFIAKVFNEFQTNKNLLIWDFLIPNLKQSSS